MKAVDETTRVEKEVMGLIVECNVPGFNRKYCTRDTSKRAAKDPGYRFPGDLPPGSTTSSSSSSETSAIDTSTESETWLPSSEEDIASERYVRRRRAPREKTTSIAKRERDGDDDPTVDDSGIASRTRSKSKQI